MKRNLPFFYKSLPFLNLHFFPTYPYRNFEHGDISPFFLQNIIMYVHPTTTIFKPFKQLQMRTSGKNSIRAKVCKLLSFGMACLVFPLAVSAQCLTNTLRINTGYTPSGPIAASAADPHWNVVALSAGIVANVSPTPPTPPYPAVGASGGGWGATNPASSWISFYNPSGAWYATTALPTTYSMTLQRTFTLCHADDIKVDLSIARDNYVTYVKIDGNPPLLVDTPQQNTSFFNSWTPLTSTTYTLAAGVHTIEVKVFNFHDVARPNQANPHGLNIVGTLTSASSSNSIVDDNNCQGYVCREDDCSEDCYWTLTGNNIFNNRNIFGTLTPHDVRIKTSNQFRGTMDVNGQFGWNTMTPTAWLHVLCSGNNPDDGSAGSDIRFENLEPGTGNILVIDPAGFVYDSRIKINPDGTVGGDPKLMQLYNEEKIKTAKLESRVTELETRLQQLAAATGAKDIVTPRADGSSLGQNVPNPFGKETLISYNVHAMQRSAYIMIYDLNGRELQRYDIRSKGEGTLTVNGEKLVPGVYMYSLVIDGQEIASKRMVFSK